MMNDASTATKSQGTRVTKRGASITVPYQIEQYQILKLSESFELENSEGVTEDELNRELDRVIGNAKLNIKGIVKRLKHE